MKTLLLALVSTFVPFMAIDAVWLTVMGKRFYAANLGPLMAATPNLLPAVLFYVLFAVGVAVFVVLPSVTGMRDLGTTFLYGAFFGLVAYATYDLTNQATLQGWPTIVSVVDMAWGAFLTGAASTIAVFAMRHFS